MVGFDLASAMLFSHVAYWFDNKENSEEIRATLELKDYPGRKWVAFTRDEWAEQSMLSKKQAIRAIANLESLGLIKKVVAKYKGRPVIWISLEEDAAFRRYCYALESDEKETHKWIQESQDHPF